jgi:ubiquinone/menaquinone biosynthesis C-methylase UbiE
VARPPERGDAERLIAEERTVRENEADVYDRRDARLGWELSVLEDWYERLLTPCREDTILDAGSGTGRYIPWLLERGAKVVAVDHSPRSLERARERLSAGTLDRVSFVEADVRALPLEDASVDRVLCSEVLSVLPAAENRGLAVQDLFRVLRPGGVCVVSAYQWPFSSTGWRRNGCFRSEYGRVPFHAFTQGEVRRLLVRAGFEDVSVVGSAVMPSLAKRTGTGREAQLRLGSTLLRHVARWVVARGVRPALQPASG